MSRLIAGGPIPAMYSAYDQSASPVLSWTAASDGTRIFGVFALDELVNLRVGATREELVHAMQHMFWAAGEIVGMFKRPDRPVRP